MDPTNVYGPGFSLPLDMRGLYTGPSESSPEILCRSVIKDSPVEWYHSWRSPGKGLVLSAGRRPDGWFLLRAEGVQFAVDPKGDTLEYQPSQDSDQDLVRHLLVNQVLPMVLNLRGREVLHASSVLGPAGALAFVGNGGYGKSTLAAALVAAGLPLLSDDAVSLRLRGGEVWTSSGLPEMNLLPHARRLLSFSDDDWPEKLRVAVSPEQHRRGDFPLQQIYFLWPSEPGCATQITAMPAREAVIELTRAAHRLDLRDGQMLGRQLEVFRQVVEKVRMKTLRFPLCPDPLELRAVVLADLN